MSEFDDDGGISDLLYHMLFDGDLIVYKPCCVFNEEGNGSQSKIIKAIRDMIRVRMAAAGCGSYTIALTPKTNFRDHLIPDYKGNRADTERPIHLSWAKNWVKNNLSAHFIAKPFMEADDLLGILQRDNTVIWSSDKDLRQIAGKHLKESADPEDPKKSVYELITITEMGELYEYSYVTEAGNKKDKTYFSGARGFYYQMLIGDSTDNILGCAERVPAMRKGKKILKRKGVGNKMALKLLARCKTVEDLKNVVGREYYKLRPNDWQAYWETQANLLFMVREADGNIIKRWTYDDRDEYMNVVTGEIFHDHNKKGEDAA